MTDQYSAGSIKILEGLEAVRKRPGMYIGSISERGLHHLVWEIVDNAIDEIMAGFAKNVWIKKNKDGSIEVTDDGRGIPVEIHPKTGVSTVETVLTRLHAGGKFDSNSYKVSGGLHGVGAAVVNALSSSFEVWVKKNGKLHYQKFENGGKPKENLKVIGDSDETGTKVKFYPDSSIFETTEFIFETINSRAKQLAYLNKGAHIHTYDEVTELKTDFIFENGLLDYIKSLNKNTDPLIREVFYIDTFAEFKERNSNEKYRIEVEVALQYNKTYNSKIFSFVNNIITNEGGTHEQGFFDSIVRIINNTALAKKWITKDDPKMSRDDVKEGVVAIISVRHPDPMFEGQTKNKLGNTDARKAVNTTLSEILERKLNENPDYAEIIVGKALNAQKNRFAAQKFRESLRKNDDIGIASLPGKLADCSSRDPKESEIYIVEGDSAGGSAKLGRDRRTQAILPLRGKVINSQKARIDKVFENREILSLITALQTGVNESFDINKLRYSKIIIMTDADVDGSHIRILLLTFFYRFFYELVERGHIYIAQPPLYQIKFTKTNIVYCYTEEEKNDILQKNTKYTNYNIQRYKGLGEMDPSQLWETTMDPEVRKMFQIQVENALEASEVFEMLMGEHVEPRKNFINKNAKYVTNIDL